MWVLDVSSLLLSVTRLSTTCGTQTFIVILLHNCTLHQILLAILHHFFHRYTLLKMLHHFFLHI